LLHPLVIAMDTANRAGPGRLDGKKAFDSASKFLQGREEMSQGQSVAHVFHFPQGPQGATGTAGEAGPPFFPRPRFQSCAAFSYTHIPTYTDIHPHASHAYLSVLRQKHRLNAEEGQGGAAGLLTPALDGQGGDGDGACVAERV
jgi:hypothetical protein